MQFQFASIADFLAMEGHGFYVWVSYAVTLAVLAALSVYPTLRRRQLQRELQRQLRIQQRRRQVERRRSTTAEPA